MSPPVLPQAPPDLEALRARLEERRRARAQPLSAPQQEVGLDIALRELRRKHALADNAAATAIGDYQVTPSPTDVLAVPPPEGAQLPSAEPTAIRGLTAQEVAAAPTYERLAAEEEARGKVRALVPGAEPAAFTERAVGRALAHLPGAIGRYGERTAALGEQHQREEQIGREALPFVATLPADLANLYLELEAAGRLPGPAGRIFNQPGHVPILGSVAEGRLVRPGVEATVGRILRQTGREATRFGALEAGKGAVEELPPEEIIAQGLAGAAGGAAYGAGSQTLRELLARLALYRMRGARREFRETRLPAGPPEAPAAPPARLATPRAEVEAPPERPAPPPPPPTPPPAPAPVPAPPPAPAPVPERPPEPVPVPRPAPPPEAAARAAVPTEQPGPVNIVPMRTDEIVAAPERFQFKNLGTEGVSPELKGVTKWNPQLAGVISVWRDPADGKTYVVNGHHRLELAKRLGVERVNVQVIDAATAKEARAEGAYLNIAEGRGTPTDVAKFMRDMGQTPGELEARGVSLRGELAKSGTALSRLAPDVFDRVAAAKVPESWGVAIGTELPDAPELQRTVLKLATESKARLSAPEVRELAKQVKAAGTEGVQQETLFGAQQVEEGLYVPRAQLSAALQKNLAADKRLFSYVSKGARPEELERAGGTKIDVEAARELAQGSATLEEVFARLATRTGPLATVLTEGARRIAHGERSAEVAKSIYPAVRAAIEQEVGRLPGHEGGAGRVAAPNAPQPPVPQTEGTVAAQTAAEAEQPPRVETSKDVNQQPLLEPVVRPASEAEATTLAEDENRLAFGSDAVARETARQLAMDFEQPAEIPSPARRIKAVKGRAGTVWVDIRGQVITGNEDLFKVLHPFRDPHMEKFHIILLDADYRIVSHTLETSGVIEQVRIRDDIVVRATDRARRTGAVHMVLAHNHPSGLADPSDSDKRLTAQVAFRLWLAGGPELRGQMVIDDEIASMIDVRLTPQGKHAEQLREQYQQATDAVARDAVVQKVGRDLAADVRVQKVSLPRDPGASPDWTATQGPTFLSRETLKLPRTLQQYDQTDVARVLKGVVQPGRVDVVYVSAGARIVTLEPVTEAAMAKIGTWLPQHLRAHGALYVILAVDDPTRGLYNTVVNAVRGVPDVEDIVNLGLSSPYSARFAGYTPAEGPESRPARRLFEEPVRPGGRPEPAGALPAKAEPEAVTPAMPEPGDPRLSVLHNLSPENLEAADKLGGFPAPSLAIVPEHVGVEGFGSITMIGKKELGDPTQTPIYNADAYTGRNPLPEYPRVRAAAAQKFVDRFKEVAKRIGDERLVPSLWDELVNRPGGPRPDLLENIVETSNAARALYLEGKGITVKPRMRAKPLHADISDSPVLRAFFKEHGVDLNAGMESPYWAAFSQALDEAIRAEGQRRATKFHKDVGEMYTRSLRDRYFGTPEEKEALFGVASHILSDQERIGKREVDFEATRTKLKLATPVESAFKAWAKEQIAPLMGAPTVRLGGRKVPYTLENVAAATPTGRAVEKGMTFGPGAARAAATTRMTDLHWLRNAIATPWGVRPKAEVEAAREKIDRLQKEWREEIVNYYRPDAFRGGAFGQVWEGLDAAHRALGRWAKRGRTESNLARELKREGFEDVPAELIEDGAVVGKAIMEVPVPYFEGKPPRAVSFDEFAGAVIPDDAPASTKEILDRRGIPYRTYEVADQRDRGEARRTEVVREFRRELHGQGVSTLYEDKARYSPRVNEFYSRVKVALATAPFAKGTGEQWLAWLERTPGGTSREEVERTGLKAILEAKRAQPVTREELQFQLGRQPMEFEESVLGGENDEGTAIYAARERLFEEYRDRLQQLRFLTPSQFESQRNDSVFFAANIVLRNARQGEPFDKDVPAPALADDLRDLAKRYYDAERAADAYTARAVSNAPLTKQARYRQYTLPGGTNYKEIIVSSPEGRRNEERYRAALKDHNDYVMMLNRQYHGVAGRAEAMTPEQRVELDRKKAVLDEMLRNREMDYTSPHWHDVENPIGHLRTTERDLEGDPDLHIEEIQSDVHQTGRKEGYRSRDAQKLTEARDAADKLDEERSTTYLRVGDEVARNLTVDVRTESIPNPPWSPGRAHWAQVGTIKIAGVEVARMTLWPPSTAYGGAQGEARGWVVNGFNGRLQNFGTHTDHRSAAMAAIRDRFNGDQADPNMIRTVLSEIVKERGAGWEHYAKLRDEVDDVGERYAEARAAYDRETQGVPKLALSRTEEWAGLMVRRAIAEAVSRGKTRLSWSTGFQQARHYGLQRVVDELEYQEVTGTLKGSMDGQQEFVHVGITPHDLPLWVGQAVADRLLAKPLEVDGYRTLAGPEFDVSTDKTLGQNEFYDRMLPRIVQDQLRRLGGGKVPVTQPLLTMPDPDAEDVGLPNAIVQEPVWSVLIPPEVSARVREKGLFAAEEGVRPGRREDLELRPEDVDEQGALFGEQVGTEASRSLSAAERDAVARLQVLRERLGLPGNTAGERAKLAAQIADLEKLVNRDKALTADELARQAIAARSEQAVPIDPAQRTLFEPTPGYGATPQEESDKFDEKGEELPKLPTPAPSVGDAVRRIFNPAGRTPAAAEMAHIVRARAAEFAREIEVSHEVLEQFRSLVSKLSKAERLAFIDAIETGTAQKHPKLQPLADALRAALDQGRKRVQDLGTGRLEHFIQDYFPHIWQRPEDARDFVSRVMGKRPLQGPRAFLKHRTIPTTREGVEAGLKPVTDNPLDLVQLKLREMNRYVMGQRILQDAKERGLLEFVRAGKAPERGHARIDDAIATVYGPMTEEGAMTVRGQYYAPEPVARVLNNYLSPGLRGNPIFDAYMYAGNTLNAVQLGLSLFHLGFVSVDAITSQLALGLEQLVRGQPLAGLANAASMWTAPFTTLVRGNKVIREYLKPGSMGGDFGKIVDALTAGGGRVRMDQFYKNNAVQAFRNALKERPARTVLKGTAGAIAGGLLAGPPGAAIGAGLMSGLLPAMMEVAAKPLMETFVPRMKLGVFADLARLELSKLPPDADVEQVRAAMAKVWDSVDNRMGQLVYDNLFWQRALKDLGMASVRALGWNLGTFRELGGGVGDVLRGKPSHKMAYLIALPIAVGLLGAVMMYLFTGHGPESLQDYFEPRTGKKDADGNDERVNLPSYMKDVVAFSRHPVQTVGHKLHPLLSYTADMLANRDYWGDQIRNEHDPLVEQLRQAADYTAAQFTPIGMRNVQEQRRRLQTGARAMLPFIGVTPANREAVRTPAQNLMAEYLRERGTGGLTPEQQAEREVRTDVADRYRRGEIGYTDARKALKASGFTPEQIKTALHRMMDRPIVTRFKQLTLEQAEAVYAKGTPEEKDVWGPILFRKQVEGRSRGVRPARPSR